MRSRASNLFKSARALGTRVGCSMRASSVITSGISSLWRRPISKSVASWAGVTFTNPVPNAGSTASSAMMGMGMSAMGRRAVFPTNPACRVSRGCTATAVSPSIVSGRVVATVRYGFGPPSTG